MVTICQRKLLWLVLSVEIIKNCENFGGSLICELLWFLGFVGRFLDFLPSIEWHNWNVMSGEWKRISWLYDRLK